MTINEKLEPIVSYLISINRNVENGWYELELGIYGSWIYSSDDRVDCVLINEFEQGKIIRLIPKNEDIIVDDLVTFASGLITFNEEIAERKRKLNEEIENLKQINEAEMEKMKAEFSERRLEQNKNLEELERKKDELLKQKNIPLDEKK